MSDQDVDIFLEHYGVKGMRWGVRNEKRGSSRKERRAKNRAFNERNARKSIYRPRKETQKRNRVSALAAGVAFLASRYTTLDVPMRVVVAGGTALATDSFLKARYDKKTKELPKEKISDSDIYSAQKSLGMKTMPDPTGSYEKAYKQMVREIAEENKLMGKDKKVFDKNEVSPNIKREDFYNRK